MAYSNPDTKESQCEIVELQLILRYLRQDCDECIEPTKEDILVEKFKTKPPYLDCCRNVLEKYHITNIHAEYQGSNVTLKGETDSIIDRDSLKFINSNLTEKFISFGLNQEYHAYYHSDFSIEVNVLQQKLEGESTHESDIPEPKCEPHDQITENDDLVKAEENTEENVANDLSPSNKKEVGSSDEISQNKDEDEKKREAEKVQEPVDKYLKDNREQFLEEQGDSSEIVPHMSLDITSQEVPSQDDIRNEATQQQNYPKEQDEKNIDKENTTGIIMAVIVDKEDEVQGDETSSADFQALPLERKEVEDDENDGAETSDTTSHLPEVADHSQDDTSKQEETEIVPHMSLDITSQEVPSQDNQRNEATQQQNYPKEQDVKNVNKENTTGIIMADIVDKEDEVQGDESSPADFQALPLERKEVEDDENDGAEPPDTASPLPEVTDHSQHNSLKREETDMEIASGRDQDEEKSEVREDLNMDMSDSQKRSDDGKATMDLINVHDDDSRTRRNTDTTDEMQSLQISGTEIGQNIVVKDDETNRFPASNSKAEDTSATQEHLAASDFMKHDTCKKDQLKEMEIKPKLLSSLPESDSKEGQLGAKAKKTTTVTMPSKRTVDNSEDLERSNLQQDDKSSIQQHSIKKTPTDKERQSVHVPTHKEVQRHVGTTLETDAVLFSLKQPYTQFYLYTLKSPTEVSVKLKNTKKSIQMVSTDKQTWQSPILEKSNMKYPLRYRYKLCKSSWLGRATSEEESQWRTMTQSGAQLDFDKYNLKELDTDSMIGGKNAFLDILLGSLTTPSMRDLLTECKFPYGYPLPKHATWMIHKDKFRFERKVSSPEEKCLIAVIFARHRLMDPSEALDKQLARLMSEGIQSCSPYLVPDEDKKALQNIMHDILQQCFPGGFSFEDAIDIFFPMLSVDQLVSFAKSTKFACTARPHKSKEILRRLCHEETNGDQTFNMADLVIQRIGTGDELLKIHSHLKNSDRYREKGFEQLVGYKMLQLMLTNLEKQDKETISENISRMAQILSECDLLPFDKAIISEIEEKIIQIVKRADDANHKMVAQFYDIAMYPKFFSSKDSKQILLEALANAKCGPLHQLFITVLELKPPQLEQKTLEKVFSQWLKTAIRFKKESSKEKEQLERVDLSVVFQSPVLNKNENIINILMITLTEEFELELFLTYINEFENQTKIIANIFDKHVTNTLQEALMTIEDPFDKKLERYLKRIIVGERKKQRTTQICVCLILERLHTISTSTLKDPEDLIPDNPPIWIIIKSVHNEVNIGDHHAFIATQDATTLLGDKIQSKAFTWTEFLYFVKEIEDKKRAKVCEFLAAFHDGTNDVDWEKYITEMNNICQDFEDQRQKYTLMVEQLEDISKTLHIDDLDKIRGALEERVKMRENEGVLLRDLASPSLWEDLEQFASYADSLYKWKDVPSMWLFCKRYVEKDEDKPAGKQAQDVVEYLQTDCMTNFETRITTIMINPDDVPIADIKSLTQGSDKSILAEAKSTEKALNQKQDEQKKLWLNNYEQIPTMAAKVRSFVSVQEIFRLKQGRGRDMDALAEFQNIVNSNFKGVYLKKVSETMDVLDEVFVILHPQNPSRMLKVIIDSENLMIFLREIIDEDLRNLIAMSEQKSHRYVSPETMSAFIKIQRVFYHLLSGEGREYSPKEFAEIIQKMFKGEPTEKQLSITSSSTAPKDMFDILHKCNENLPTLRMLFQSITNRGEHTRAIIGKALSQGKVKFELNKRSKHCSFTLFHKDAEDGTETEQQNGIQQEELNDLRSRAFLITDTMKEINKSELDCHDVSREDLRRFVDAIDICFQIAEVCTQLCLRGHFDFQQYDQDVDSLDKEHLSHYHITLSEQLKDWNKYLEEVQANYFYMNYVWGDQLCELRRCLATNEETEKSKAILKFIHPKCQLPNGKQNFDGDLKEQLTLIGETLDKMASLCSPFRRNLENIKIQNLEMKIKKGEPYIAHLAGTGSEMIPVIMQLYGDTVEKFPEPYNLLLCQEETTWDEIHLLLARCFHPKRPMEIKELFCIANIECLPSEVQFELTSHLQRYLVQAKDANRRNFYLCMVCKSSSQDPIIQHFAKFKHQVNGVTTAQMETILKENWANVEVVTSELPGLGKTEHIRERAAGNGTATATIKISGPLTRDELVDKFISIDMRKQQMLHIDIGDTPYTTLLNGFLFELIVMGMVSSGTKIGILPTKNVAIEVANSIQHGLIDKMVFIKRFKSIHLKWGNFSDYKISKEPNSSVRVVCDYLHSLKQREIDTQNINLVGKESSRPLLDDRVCRELLTEYFGKDGVTSEITFSVMKVYLDVLANQLKKMSASDYFRVENIREMVSAEYSDNMRSTLLKALLIMSKDFARRSVGTCRSLQGAAVMDESQAMVKRVEGMIKWADSNHLMILFHEKDAQTVSPLYRNLKQVSSDVTELFKSQNKELEDFNHLSPKMLRIILERIVCRDIGRDRGRVADIEKNYVLTPDNLLKMVLISLRIRVRIPVILMGETGCGKTSLVRYLAAISGVRLEIFNVHAGITERQIKETVLEMHKKAIQSPKQELWLFVDEINTCDHLGLLCDIICHRKCHGRLLASNLVMLSACNPYRLRKKNQILTSGLKGKVSNDNLSKLVYRVHPLPEAMIDYVWDYGVLVESDEKDYIRCMVENIDLKHTDPKQNDKLVSLLTKSQALLRDFEETEWSVSLRDVQRCIHLLFFFEQMLIEKAKCGGTEHSIDERREKAILLALTHCYYSRLPSSVQRKKYLTSIAEVFDSTDTQSKADEIADMIKKEQMDLLKRMKIPKGIARNSALRENVFILFVCILNKIPVFVVGKPGSSKSLSIQLLGDNLRGRESSDNYFETLPQLYIVPYQGSESSTSSGLQKVFEKADEYYEHTKGQNVLPVILLDEVGLAEVSEFNPLKVLHNLLEPTSGEDLKVAVVGISNWALDAAKMNRAIHLSRPDLDEEELIDTANSIGSEYLDEKTLDEYKIHFTALAKAYVEYQTHQRQEHFHGLRDYYSFVKHVTQRIPELGDKDDITEVISESLLRNFGGMRKEEKKVFDTFQESLKKLIPRFKQLELASKSVSLKSLILSNLEDFDARYLLLTTYGETAMGYIKTLLKEQDKEYEIIIGSHFEEDQTEDYSYRILNRIILCMERDVVLILKDLDHIYGSLYDMLNQNYNRVGKKQFCRVAIGPYFNPVCLVHDKFRCIVLVDKSEIPFTDPPFLNRFEKQYFILTDTMTVEEKRMVRSVKEWVQSACSVKESHFKTEESFLGYHSELIPSLVSYCMRDADATEDAAVKKDEVFKKCKNLLLLLATPDAVLRCRKSELDSRQTEEMEKKYFVNPMQNNILDCVKQELDIDIEKKKGLRLIVLTHSNIHNNLEMIVGKNLHRNFDVKKLAAFKSEKELSKHISKFWFDSDDEILFLQCKPSLDADHILLATSQIETCANRYSEEMNAIKHVVFIIHIDQKDLEIEKPWQFNFLSGWTIVTIDMLGKKEYSLTEILGNPIFEVLDAGIIPLEDIVKKHLFWAFYTFKYTPKDTGTIQETKELVESILQCDPLISELAKVIKSRIEIETEIEDHHLQQTKWQVAVACDKKAIAEAPTFYAALMQKVEDLVKPTLAKLVFKLENMSAWDSYLKATNEDTKDIWNTLLEDKEISDTSGVDDPTGPGCYQVDPIKSGLGFPFVKHYEEKLKKVKALFLENGDLDSLDEQQKEMTEKYLKVFENVMQPLWAHPYFKTYIDTYLEDMLCLPWHLEKSITVKLLCWVLDSRIPNSKEIDPLERFILYHLWYWGLESMLHDINVLMNVCLDNIPSGIDKLTEMICSHEETEDETRPEECIADFFCKEMLPTNEIIRRCSSMENWQCMVDILLLYVSEVSLYPDTLHFLKLCNDYASQILLPYKIDKDELIALGEIGEQKQREAMVSGDLQNFIFDIPDRLNDKVPCIALQRFICQFIRRYIEFDQENKWLDSIVEKALLGALPESDLKFFGIVLTSRLLTLGEDEPEKKVEEEEEEEEEERNLFNMLCSLLLKETDSKMNLRDLDTICRKLQNVHLAGKSRQSFVTLLIDVVETVGLKDMPTDILGKCYKEQSGLELLQHACDIFRRKDTYTIQCIVAVAFIRNILKKIAICKETTVINPSLLQALNICRSHPDEENELKRLYMTGYFLQCLGNNSMAKLQTTIIPQLSIENSYLLEIDWPKKDIILGLGFNPFTEDGDYQMIEKALLEVEEKSAEECYQRAQRSPEHMAALFSYILVNYTYVKAVRPLKDTEEKAIDLLFSKIDIFAEKHKQLLCMFLGKQDFSIQMLQLSEQSSLLDLQQSSILYRLMLMVVAKNSKEICGPFAVCMLSPQDAGHLIRFWNEDLHGTLYTHYGCFQQKDPQSQVYLYFCIHCGSFVAEISITETCSNCESNLVRSEKKEIESKTTTKEIQLEENEICQYVRGMPPLCHRIFQIFLQGSLLSSIALDNWNDEKMTKICKLTKEKIIQGFRYNWEILKTMLNETDAGLCRFLHVVIKQFSTLIVQTQNQCLTDENMQMFEENFIEKFKEQVKLKSYYDWYTKICLASGYRLNEIESILREVYTDAEINAHSVSFQQTQAASLQHLKHHFMVTYTECEDCDTPFLGYVLRQEKQLQLLKHLHPLISWRKKVHAILFRKVTEREVQELKIEDFMKKYEKDQELGTLYKQFEESWNKLADEKALRILQLGKDFEVPRMFSGQDIALSLGLHHDSKIQILISALQEIQNDCLTEALRIAVQSKSSALNFLRRSNEYATVRLVSVLSASKEDVIDFEWDDDILVTFSQANTKCGMRREVQYDLKGLEKELAVVILIGKKYLRSQEVPVFVYAGQFFHANSAILDDIKEQIHQEKLPDDIVSDLSKRKADDPSYARMLNEHLDIIIPLIKRTGGKATEPLIQFAKNWFPKESAPLSRDCIPGQDNIQLCHLVHLYESVEELRMESTFLGLPNKFRQPLDEEQKSSIDAFIKNKYFTVKTIMTALGRLVLRYINENGDIIKPDHLMKDHICKPAFWSEGVEPDGKVTKAQEVGAPKQTVGDLFPQGLQLCHVFKTWEKMELLIKEKEKTKKKTAYDKTRSRKKRVTRT